VRHGKVSIINPRVRPRMGLCPDACATNHDSTQPPKHPAHQGESNQYTADALTDPQRRSGYLNEAPHSS